MPYVQRGTVAVNLNFGGGPFLWEAGYRQDAHDDGDRERRRLLGTRGYAYGLRAQRDLIGVK